MIFAYISFSLGAIDSRDVSETVHRKVVISDFNLRPAQKWEARHTVFRGDPDALIYTADAFAYFLAPVGNN